MITDDHTPLRVHAESTETAAARERLAGLSRDNYELLYSVMKSVSAAAGAFTLSKFAGAHGQAWWVRVSFWTTSFLGIVITYHATMVGSVLHQMRLSVFDSAFPLLLTACEALLFFLLANHPGSGGVPTAWYLTYSIWAAIAATIIWRVFIETSRSSRHALETAFRRAAHGYLAHLRRDGVAAVATSVVALGFWVAKWQGVLTPSEPWEAVIGSALSAGLLLGLRNQTKALATMRVALAETAGFRSVDEKPRLRRSRGALGAFLVLALLAKWTRSER